MIDILRRKMEKDYPVGSTRRDAHPKSLGVIRGSFEVMPGLSPELKVGVFQSARSFDCWLRFSNSSGRIQSDAAPDVRGVGIKLLDAAKLGANAKSLGQDFVLLSTPTMPLGTVKMFRDAIYYTIESSALWLLAKFLITGKLGALLKLRAARSTPPSPLDIRYWSTTPYRFGKDGVVKYSIVPTSNYRSSMPEHPTENYLSEAMQAHLKNQPATFDFCVQFQKDGMPIEDAAVRWDETKSPFVKLATLVIPPQEFRTAERDVMGESLSFSPGHAWPEHSPLGALNHARAIIYEQLSSFRHQRDRRTDHS
jgi:hypothetical protein